MHGIIFMPFPHIMKFDQKRLTTAGQETQWCKNPSKQHKQAVAYLAAAVTAGTLSSNAYAFEIHSDELSI